MRSAALWWLEKHHCSTTINRVQHQCTITAKTHRIHTRRGTHAEQYCAIALHRKTNTNRNPDPNRYRRRCHDPNARIQKTEELQIKTENTNLRLRKYERCIFLILPPVYFYEVATFTASRKNSWLAIFTATLNILYTIVTYNLLHPSPMFHSMVPIVCLLSDYLSNSQLFLRLAIKIASGLFFNISVTTDKTENSASNKVTMWPYQIHATLRPDRRSEPNFS